MLAELAEEAGYVFWTTDLKLYNTAKDRRVFSWYLPLVLRGQNDPFNQRDTPNVVVELGGEKEGL